MLTLFLGNTLVALLLGLGKLLLDLLLLVLGVDLGDAGSRDVVELILGIATVDQAHKLILIGGKIVVLIILLLLIGVVLVVAVKGNDVVSCKVDVVVTDNLEENLLVLANDNVEGLLVLLFILSAIGGSASPGTNNVLSGGPECR